MEARKCGLPSDKSNIHIVVDRYHYRPQMRQDASLNLLLSEARHVRVLSLEPSSRSVETLSSMAKTFVHLPREILQQQLGMFSWFCDGLS
jgi:hypothetical protein